ncbi:hypothetical protein J2X07_003919 [Fictibacillus barbaricus]|uniref:Uncharacterized protein n=1 Tax=Fictibacillus barbaricus TaxID=182136 RepID=A0ABU1U5Y4_9BACL|nr:hypothetical protein [Fictibacillus barbaricus]
MHSNQLVNEALYENYLKAAIFQKIAFTKDD